jgi:hypothetical protein
MEEATGNGSDGDGTNGGGSSSSESISEGTSVVVLHESSLVAGPTTSARSPDGIPIQYRPFPLPFPLAAGPGAVATQGEGDEAPWALVRHLAH